MRVITRMTADPDRVDDLRRLLRELTSPTRAEPGCVSFELLGAVDNPAEFVLVGQWTTRDAYEAHIGSAHVKDAIVELPSLIEGALESQMYAFVA